MASYKSERRQFKSFQYFAEKQLHEAFRMTEYDSLPSTFRTAVVVDLLGCLGQLFVRFESPFTDLYQEVLRSIYTEYVNGAMNPPSFLKTAMNTLRSTLISHQFTRGSLPTSLPPSLHSGTTDRAFSSSRAASLA